MRLTPIAQVDTSTGEILDGATLAVVYPRRRNGFREGWVAMAQEAMMELARANLGSQANRVLFALLATLDFENYLVINQAQLARELGMKQPNVSRAVARLKLEGVILAGPKVANLATYTLNPRYGWKGSAKNHQAALQARMRARGLSVVGDDEIAPQRDLGPSTGT